MTHVTINQIYLVSCACSLFGQVDPHRPKVMGCGHQSGQEVQTLREEGPHKGNTYSSYFVSKISMPT